MFIIIKVLLFRYTNDINNEILVLVFSLEIINSLKLNKIISKTKSHYFFNLRTMYLAQASSPSAFHISTVPTHDQVLLL